MHSRDQTWVGYAPAPRPTRDDGEDRTAVEPFRARAEANGVIYVSDQTERSTFGADALEELRRRLREAEAREVGSGVRPRPTPEEGIARPPAPALATGADDALDLDIEVDIEVETPRRSDELDAVMSSLPELEVALAPNSESNFYAGFDDEHPDGVFVATYQTLATETPVYVTVHLPAGYRFRTPALVEWVREPEAADVEAPAGVGLKMCGLDHEMRRLIRSFCRHRSPIFYVG